MTRITANYIEGKNLGDLGYSNLLHGTEVSKSSHFGEVYSTIEWFQHGLMEYLFKDGDARVLSEECRTSLSLEDINFLNWLHSTLFSLSSFCYRKGNSDPRFGLVLDEQPSTFLEKRIRELKKEEETLTGKPASSEFVRQSGTLNKLRILCRDVERAYVGWFHEEAVVIKEMHLNPHILEHILRYQQFLNRLSTYFYWLSRVSLIQKDLVLEPWISRIPPFPISHENTNS